MKNPNIQLEPIPLYSQIFFKKFQQAESSPSSHELCLLKKEFKKRLEFLNQTGTTTQKNKDEVGMWIKGNDVKIKVKGNSIKVQLSEQGTIKIQKQVDYSKVKVSIPNEVQQAQIPFTTFQSYCDQYFRPLTEEDVLALEKDCNKLLIQGDPSSFIIPTSNISYKERFRLEDMQCNKLQMEGIIPSGKEYYEHDDTVFEGELPVGSLSSRLLGALVNEGIVPSLDDDEVDQQKESKRPREDSFVLQDRLREELTFLGLCQPTEEEPSEIKDELVETINELQRVVAENRKKKDALAKIAELHLGYQEYQSLLLEANKAVEQAYIKKFKRTKPSIIKKKPTEREVILILT